MLKRLFLSIIILSTLASESGAYYSADLIDYYLVNLAHLDIIQDSRNAISSLDSRKQNLLVKKGIPIAFFKAISQDAINSNNSESTNRNSRLEFLWMSGIAIVLTIFLMSIITLNTQILRITRRALLSLSDSSPPVHC